MKRLRIYARVASFYNPCIYAVDINPANPLLVALQKVCDVVGPLTYRLDER